MLKCSQCSNPGCQSAKYCTPWKTGVERAYGASAIRYTADGFDCALPVSMDTYNTCAFGCMYCFSNHLVRNPLRKGTASVKAINPREVEKFFLKEDDGDYRRPSARMLRKTSAGSYRCPIQWGALGDPFDYIERQQGVSLEIIPIMVKYKQPTRISTKGANVIVQKPYLDAFSENPSLFWVAWSIISIDDDILTRIDRYAPNATERLKAMKVLSKLGIKNSLRLRPIFPGITDSTPKHPKAWRDLLRRSADAGAKAVSMEFVFVPQPITADLKNSWDKIKNMVGFDIVSWYKKTSIHGSCLRSSRAWKEDLTFAIRDEAHKLGMTFGISDPHWKELNDSGCCCGILPDDPVFGGWQRTQAVQAILDAKAGKKIVARDYVPFWAKDVMKADLVVMTGAKNAFDRATETWEDKLRQTWNDLQGARGPLHYFGGCLYPVGKKDGDVVYEYREIKRTGLTTPHFKV